MSVQQSQGTPNLVGQVIENHRVIRQIAQGAMGMIFESVHLELGRRAAVKVLRPEYAKNADIVARFLNEARAVNVVRHPGVVNIFELGQLPDGAAYIVMEYLEGETLNQRIHRHRGRPLPNALRLSRQIASALAAAHLKGIIHRDLKPDNVMVVPDPDIPGGERTKVLDFGLAKVSQELRTGRWGPIRSVNGLVMGTPRYMSPEQCRGVTTVTGKVDVYALGLMLYQMLSGRTPFQAEQVADMLAQHLREEPRPLSELAPDTPIEVAALVHAMLAKQAELRPAMDHVARELERLEERYPPPASGSPPPGAPAVADGPGAAPLGASLGSLIVPRSPARYWALGILALAGVGLASAWWAGWPRPRSAPPPVSDEGKRDPDQALARLAEKRVQQELVAQTTYEHLVEALEQKDYDHALQLYQEIPLDSGYWGRARGQIDASIQPIVTASLGKVRAARAAGRCEEAAARLERLLSVAPSSSAALRMKKRPCPAPATEGSSAAPLGALPRPDPAVPPE